VADISVTVELGDVPDDVASLVMDDLFNLIVDATPVRTGFAQSHWKMADNVISNDCDYISFLEDGWSDQAPDGMIGPALEQLSDIIQKYMAEYEAQQMYVDPYNP
jgi:hypothetical protein